VEHLIRLTVLGSGLVLALSCEEGAQLSLEQERLAIVSASAVDEGLLQRYVEELVAERLEETPTTVSWYPEHSFSHVRSADYIERVLRDELQFSPIVEDSNDDGIAGRNIYVDIGGTVAPDEMVVVSAHYDAWFSGADDNASGVAVLLEAARIFRDALPERTVRIVAFDLEEYGVIGANRYVRAHGTDGVVAVLNLDAVGYASDAPGSQKAPPGLSLRDRGDFIAVLANAPAASHLSRVARLSNNLPEPVEMLGLLTPDDAHYPGLRDFLRSDHAPFWRRGIPALFFTDTASFRNSRYHTEEDTPDTLDYGFFSRAAQLIIGTARALATLN
jgi:hypothetical protein